MELLFLGLNGSGKSTFTYILSKETDWFEMDVEGYYFPDKEKPALQ